MIELCGNITRIYSMSYSKAWHIHIPKHIRKFSLTDNDAYTGFLRHGAVNTVALKPNADIFKIKVVHHMVQESFWVV